LISGEFLGMRFTHFSSPEQITRTMGSDRVDTEVKSYAELLGDFQWNFFWMFKV
jgi:hypothetical protein